MNRQILAAVGVIVAVIVALSSCVTVGTVTPLHEAVRDGNLEAARVQTGKGANVDARDGEGRTPLHYACANGDGDMAVLLLEAGADPNVQDADGNTPLHYVASNCYVGLAEMVLSAGADRSLVNAAGQTARDLAEGIGCLDIAELLGR